MPNAWTGGPSPWGSSNPWGDRFNFDIPDSYWDFTDRFMPLAIALAMNRLEMGEEPMFPYLDLRDPAALADVGYFDELMDWFEQMWNTHHKSMGGEPYWAKRSDDKAVLIIAQMTYLYADSSGGGD